jgi:hypothetical protein
LGVGAVGGELGVGDGLVDRHTGGLYGMRGGVGGLSGLE